MFIKRAVIVVCDESLLNSNTFFDACSLALAASESVMVLGSVPEHIQHRAKTLQSFGEGHFEFFTKSSEEKRNNREELFSELDQFPLETNLLVVTIGSSAKLNLYVSSRLQSEINGILQWHVVSSNYARYALLDKQRSLSTFVPRDTGVWIRDLIKKYGRREIFSSLDELHSIKALVIGETILDKYVYCNSLGKVSKDPLVAFEIEMETIQLGGILAIAKHAAGLGASVSVRSEIGQNQRDIINRGIGPNIDLSNVIYHNCDSIIKTRYVDRGSNVRVFETYEMPKFRNMQTGKKLINQLQIEKMANYDLAIILDYGHSLIDEVIIKNLLDTKIDLVANAQSNAGNRGFNPISRYRGAWMTFLNGSEVEIETRSKSIDLLGTVDILGKSLETQELYVTNGSRGLICWGKGLPPLSVPAFAPSVVDRVGAGDALLTITALLRKLGVEREIAAFYGNIAGALIVSSMGNETSLNYNLVRQTTEEIINALSQEG